MYTFITDDKTFSIEHFVISATKNRKLMVNDSEYIIEDTIYKRYVNNFFNFIFIDQDTNTELGNNWLPEKLNLLKDKKILCEYSKMIIRNLDDFGKEFAERGGDGYKDKLDLFFVREYKELYIQYTKNSLDDVIKRINNYSKIINVRDAESDES